MPTYYTTRAQQQYVVPAGVNYIKAICAGAPGYGANSIGGGGRPGRGAVITAIMKTTPGETLNIWVGATATAAENNNPAVEDVTDTRPVFGGGGSVMRYRSGYSYGNKGGGSTDIRRVNRVITAGGGGGKGQSISAGYDFLGGDGGAANAPGGAAEPPGWGGAGGGTASGGAHGAEVGDGAYHTHGSWNQGGTGAFTGNFNPGGGGGGGGQYGGGGGTASSAGHAGGGGGGSSYVDLTQARVVSSAVGDAGNASTTGGYVVIDPYVTPQPTISFPVTPHVAPRYAFQVDIKDPHPLSTGTRTVTYELSQDSTFATGVQTKTVNFVANGADGKRSTDPSIASVASGMAMNFWASLLATGTWYIRTKTGGDNGLADSAWSATSSFVVTQYVPPAPSISFPVPGTTARRFAFAVDVKAVHPLTGGTQSIVYELSPNADYSAPITKTVAFVPNGDDAKVAGDPEIADVSSGLVQNFWVTLPSQGTWHLRTKVIGNQGLADTSWTTASFTSSHAPAATIVSPTGSAYLTYAANTAFRINATDPWAADTITAYQLIVERNDTGVVIVDTGKVLLAEAAPLGQITINQALATSAKDTLLRWKIRIWDNTDVASPYTDYALFTLVDAPVVGITAPAEGAELESGVPVLAWTVGLTAGRTVAQSVITVREQATNAEVWKRTTGAGILTVTPETTILVNEVGYSVTIEVTDSVGLVGTDSNLFSTSYVSPDPILYTVDASLINTEGYVEVNWGNQSPDPRLIAWRIYRRELPSNVWELMEEIPDEAVKLWRDYLVKSGRSYMYTVSQLADRSGAILESPVGTRFTQDGPQAEAQINQLLINNYWIIVPDQPDLSVRLPGVTSAGETEEYDSATYTIINRGRHVDYGDRLGYSGSMTVQIRQPERESLLRARIELLRAAQETYYLRTPFGRLFQVALGNLGWDPLAGTGSMEMGDMTIPYLEVA